MEVSRSSVDACIARFHQVLNEARAEPFGSRMRSAIGFRALGYLGALLILDAIEPDEWKKLEDEANRVLFQDPSKPTIEVEPKSYAEGDRYDIDAQHRQPLT